MYARRQHIIERSAELFYLVPQCFSSRDCRPRKPADRLFRRLPAHDMLSSAAAPHVSPPMPGLSDDMRASIIFFILKLFYMPVITALG